MVKSGDVAIVKYSFIAITVKFIQIGSGSTC